MVVDKPAYPGPRAAYIKRESLVFVIVGNVCIEKLRIDISKMLITVPDRRVADLEIRLAGDRIDKLEIDPIELERSRLLKKWQNFGWRTEREIALTIAKLFINKICKRVRWRKRLTRYHQAERVNHKRNVLPNPPHLLEIIENKRLVAA